MKKILRCLLIVAALLQLPAGAFTYTDTDLLLVFRKDGFNDVLFNLGTVSNYLGHADGTRLTVSNWDVATVRSNYDLGSGVKFLLLASTDSSADDLSAWMTDGETNTTPFERTPSAWQVIWSYISQIGIKAALGTLQDTSSQTYVVSPTDPHAYTFLASNRGIAPSAVPKLGNVSAFIVEQTVPGTMRFFDIKPSTDNPKPKAVQIGTFSLSLDGQLEFVAGTGASGPGPIPPPAITQVNRQADVTSITFGTTNGVNYRLRFTAPDGLTTSRTNWSIAPGVKAGDGNPQTLTHPSGAAESFLYSVEAYR